MAESGRRVLVTGAGGFIGHHLVKHLKKLGYWVRGVDIKAPMTGNPFAAKQAAIGAPNFPNPMTERVTLFSTDYLPPVVPTNLRLYTIFIALCWIECNHNFHLHSPNIPSGRLPWRRVVVVS